MSPVADRIRTFGDLPHPVGDKWTPDSRVRGQVRRRRLDHNDYYIRVEHGTNLRSTRSQERDFPQEKSGLRLLLNKLMPLPRLGADPKAFRRAVKALVMLHASYLPDGHAGFDEDGEIILFWVNGHRSVELNIPGAGQYYVRITDSRGEELYCGFSDDLPFASIRAALTHLDPATPLMESIREW